MDWISARNMADAMIAFGTLAALVWSWVALIWPRLQAAWRKRPMAEIREGIAALRTETAEMRRLGEAEAAKGTQRGRDLQVLTKEFRQFRSKVDALVAADPMVATFDAAPDGTLTAASETLQQWTGRGAAQLLRWNWITTVAASERVRVRGEVDSAVRDVRRATLRFPMLDAEGKEFEVVATWTPIPENEAPCEKFVVVLQRQ